jgi:hypothetical protein
VVGSAVGSIEPSTLLCLVDRCTQRNFEEYGTNFKFEYHVKACRRHRKSHAIMGFADIEKQQFNLCQKLSTK